MGIAKRPFGRGNGLPSRTATCPVSSNGRGWLVPLNDELEVRPPNNKVRLT